MSIDTWIDRVRAADAEAEAATVEAMEYAVSSLTAEKQQAYALIAIAAELRAARIARRPGAGAVGPTHPERQGGVLHRDPKLDS